MEAKGIKNVLLTGASGYVGGRLLRILQNQDIRLRCLARIPSYLQKKSLSPHLSSYHSYLFYSSYLIILKALPVVQELFAFIRIL